MQKRNGGNNRKRNGKRNGGNNGENNRERNVGKKCRVSHTHRLHYYIYVNKRGKQKNYTNYTQNPTQTLHLSDFPHVAKCIVCASNYTQTIHKPYTATIHNHQTTTIRKTKNYTNALKPYTKPYILFRTRSARNVQNLNE